MTEKLLGSIEAGGTKFVCGVGTDDLTIVERVSFPTTTPEETMKKVIEFFQQYPLKAIGIGSFGPIDIHVDSPTYGYITSTPKLAWRNFDLLGTMKQHFDVPMAWTTDVNAADMVSMLLEMGNIHLVVYIIQLELVLALERFKTVSLLKALATQKWGMR